MNSVQAVQNAVLNLGDRVASASVTLQLGAVQDLHGRCVSETWSGALTLIVDRQRIRVSVPSAASGRLLVRMLRYEMEKAVLATNSKTTVGHAGPDAVLRLGQLPRRILVHHTEARS
jgi:hypothetical protein